MTTRRVHLWCVWCGPVFALVLFGGMLLAGLLPPPSPGDSAAEVADFYGDATDRKRLGLLLVFAGGGLTAPFVVVISAQLKRIAGASSMSVMQLIGGGLGVLAIVLPSMIFMAAAFRPERSPEVTQALHDLAFIPFVGNFVPAVIQCLAVAIAVLMQRESEPVLPRWLGYFNLWTALVFLPGGLLIFFKSGALAWNGAVAFWLVAVIFGAWFWVMFFTVRRAILAEPA